MDHLSCVLCLMQTVELKVSMHCYGCAKKVQKHISKMDGMTTDPYPCPLLGLSICVQNHFILDSFIIGGGTYI